MADLTDFRIAHNIQDVRKKSEGILQMLLSNLIHFTGIATQETGKQQI